MSQTAILQPVCVLILITIAVWLVLFARRLGYLATHKLDPDQIADARTLESMLPPAAVAASNNFKNLFEVPVIFYTSCVIAVLAGVVDSLLLGSAWAYVSLRALHSLVHCTYNRVNHRFMAYLASCLVLWFMVIRVSLQLF
ncbi:MAPEG family protein [Pseudomaricurvus sp. HS19]|uniref:MAPEG family protein n=1 Tax=Pseudomaricurvus sp. HS19 TaxID=2692626 RepID=UPI00136972F8|nr:MAPEG family protein [Pseudomaricurvus sp. HS19]MYM64156.1 hypothetical protein [Pseudomaricurvus sp. HS19]